MPLETDCLLVILICFNEAHNIIIVLRSLDAYTSQLEVLNAIAFEDEKGRTNTASGLRAAEMRVLVGGYGDRAGVFVCLCVCVCVYVCVYFCVFVCMFMRVLS